MTEPDFDFDRDDTNEPTNDVAGAPEGDGDFESDNLRSTGETSSGGQLDTSEAEQKRRGLPPMTDPGPQKPTGLERIIDEISTGKIMP